MKRNTITTLILCCLCTLPNLAIAKTLTQKEVLALTYQNAPQGQSLGLNKKIAEQNAQKASAQYDTFIFGNVSHTFDQSAKSSIILGTESQTTTFSLGVSQTTPLGSQFTLTSNNTRQKTNSTFVSANELYEPKFSLSLTQPLLKNSFGLENRNSQKLAKTQSQALIQKSDADLLNLALQNVTLYWNWYYLKRIEILAEESVQLAQKLFDANIRKQKLGLIEKLDLSAFNANLQMKKADLITAQINADSLKETLKAQLGLTDEPTLGQESFQNLLLKSEADSLSLAIENNKTLAALKNQLLSQNIAISIYKNSRLPQLDLQGSLALNGLDTTYNKALNDVPSPHPTWMAGIGLSFPLQNRNAKNDYKTSVLQKEQLLYQLKDQENQLIATVKSTLTNCKRLQDKINLLATAVEQQRLKWQGEELKYTQGRSDTDLIITYQNDYIQTQLLYWKSKTDLKLEYAKYQTALGQISFGES